MDIQRPAPAVLTHPDPAGGRASETAEAARPAPWALWGVRLDAPADGWTVTDPLVVAGRVRGRLRSRLLGAARRALGAGARRAWEVDLLLDGAPVARLGPEEAAGGRFVAQVAVPGLAEGLHVLSLGAPGCDPALAWSRRTVRLRRTASTAGPVRAATRWTLVRLHLVHPSPRPRILIDQRSWDEVGWRVRRNGTGWWGDALLDLAHLPVGRHRVVVETAGHPAVRLDLHRLSEYH
ncbi:MAG TPA: hypothetical protein VLF66_07630 [Thermoanaerobaculia bacterium]|nr:hypothetical protein [Thermoanaerobaculia bacterium]